jgi:hypothetical protein
VVDSDDYKFLAAKSMKRKRFELANKVNLAELEKLKEDHEIERGKEKWKKWV